MRKTTYSPQEYFRSPVMLKTAEYVDGKICGKVEKYYSNAKIAQELEFENGVLVSVKKWYNRYGENTPMGKWIEL